MKGPRFIEAEAMFHNLLDRHEKGAERPLAYPDREGFASVVDGDRFDRAVLEATQSGLIETTYGAGTRRREIRHVRLLDAEGLYRRLGRDPTALAAATARSQVLDGIDLHPAVAEAAEAAFASWARQTTWCGLGIDAIPEMRSALRLAQAIVEGRHEGMDYRTFSRRAVKDSKALERLEAAVLRLLAGAIDLPPAGKPRAVFAAIGLERIGQPILIAGPVAPSDGSPEIAWGYVGLPPSDIVQVRFVRKPEYVLTIENLVSFNRHVTEADPERRGLTVYVGGYPSLSIQKALAHLGSSVQNEVPFFHWSDIDPHGVAIYQTVEKATARPFLPHLMSAELAERYGTPISPSSRLALTTRNDCGLAGLATYFSGPDAKTMEQEEIDPSLPGLPGCL